MDISDADKLFDELYYEDLETIYERKAIERLLEDDEIGAAEAAFMYGYMEEET